MAEWEVLFKSQEKIVVSSHTVEVQSSGALVFKNNGEGCPRKIIAADCWVSVDRIADNKQGYLS